MGNELYLAKTVMWALFIIPWLSLFLMNRVALRKYVSVGLLSTVLVTIVYQLAWTYGWWKYQITLFSWDKVAQVHTVYGVFLVGTIWTFRWTYGKFWAYFLLNLVVDSVYAYGFRTLWKVIGITSGGNMPPIGSLLMMTFIALVLYGFQMWLDDAFVKGEDEPGHHRLGRNIFRKKIGAR